MNVCVIGLGRIGLPMAAVCAKKGHKVIGVDTSDAAVNAVTEGKPLFFEPELEELVSKHGKDGSLTATKDVGKAVAESKVVVVTIGTSVSEDGFPLLDNAFDVARNIGKANPNGKTIIFKPTLPLGTTRILVGEIEKQSGLKCGKDFYAAFSPERIVEGKAVAEMQSLTKVIGGMDAESSRRAVEFYKTIGGEIVVVEKPEAAEMVKLLDNSFRSTLFAFSNDVALACEDWKLNAFEVIAAANHGYERNRIANPSCGVSGLTAFDISKTFSKESIQRGGVAKPSCGVSGYCLTKDPIYLESGFSSIAKNRGFSSLWKRGREINDYMPKHTMNLVRDALESRKIGLKGARVVICGVTYKENVDDVRNSHGVIIAESLRNEGAVVSVWDPRAEKVDFPRLESAEAAFENADAVVFTVPHKEFKSLDVESLAKKMRTPVVIDGWGLFLNLRGNESVEYRCVGVG
ncbi:MAG: nucleotide sugar dehydrogenase [Candidatus Micrarchaeota archaeon]